MVSKKSASEKSKGKGEKDDDLKLEKETVKDLSRVGAKGGRTRTQGRDIFAPPDTETNCSCTCRPIVV